MTSRRFVQLAAGIAVLQLAVVLPPALTSYFAVDDWLYLALADERPWSSDWLTSGYFEHFAPAHRALFSVMAATGFRSWTAVVIIECLMLAGATFLFALALRRLGVRAEIALAATAVFALHPALVRPLEWLSAGAQIVPTLLVVAVVLFCFARWRDEPRRRFGVIASVAVAVGLLFYIRPLFALASMTALALASVHPCRPAGVFDAARRHAGFWVPIAVPATAYAVYYLTGDFLLERDSRTISLTQYGEMLRISWLRGYSPGLTGQLLPATDAIGTLDRLAQLAAQAGVIAVVGLSVLRGGWGATRLWLVFGLIFAANVYVLGSQRVDVLGVGIAGDPRYAADFLWLFPLTAALAWTVPARPGWSGLLDRRPRFGRRVALAAGIGALGALGAASAGAHWTDNAAWLGRESRDWAENLERSVERLPPGAQLVDGEVPAAVLPDGFAPSNRYAALAPFAGADGLVQTTASARLHVADRGGTIRPALFTPVHRQRLEPSCLTPGTSAALSFTPPLTAPPGGAYLRLTGVRASRRGRLSLAVATPDADLVLSEDPFEARPGRVSAVAWLGPAPAITQIRVDGPSSGRVCIGAAEVGGIRAR